MVLSRVETTKEKSYGIYRRKYANNKQDRSEVAIALSRQKKKSKFKIKTLYVTKRIDIVKRNTIKNIYVLNDSSTKYMKQKWTELKGKIVVQ